MRALILESPADPHSLKLTELPIPLPGTGEVRVKISSIGLNRADLLYCQGRYFIKPMPGSRVGFEGAGVVDAVGPGVSLTKNARVALTPLSFDVGTQGCIAEYGIYRATDLLPTPDNISDDDAGALWMAYLTAWGGLVDAGQLKRGELVVITAASSSVGIAAIQVAKMLGARTVATTSASNKAQRLKELGADDVLVTGEGSAQANEHYVDQIKAIANDQGSDLVFDAVAGPASRGLVQGSKRGGRIVIHGMLDRRPMDIHAGGLMKRLLTISGYTLDQTLHNPEQKERAVEQLNNAFAANWLTPVIAQTHRLSEYQAAMNSMASNMHIGKIVIVP